jgi:hypothetical protein
MLPLILIFSGCTEGRVKPVSKLIVPEDSMLVHPCSPVDDFNTPRELSIVNTKNIGCIEKYKLTLDKLSEWKQKQQLIYKEK